MCADENSPGRTDADPRGYYRIGRNVTWLGGEGGNVWVLSDAGNVFEVDHFGSECLRSLAASAKTAEMIVLSTVGSSGGVELVAAVRRFLERAARAGLVEVVEARGAGS